jgi:hypothetical protein
MSDLITGNLVAFLIFTILNGLSALGGALMIRKLWKSVQGDYKTGFWKTYDAIRFSILIPPFIAFSCGFVFFAFKMLATLFTNIVAAMK